MSRTAQLVYRLRLRAKLERSTTICLDPEAADGLLQRLPGRLTCGAERQPPPIEEFVR